MGRIRENKRAKTKCNKNVIIEDKSFETIENKGKQRLDFKAYILTYFPINDIM